MQDECFESRLSDGKVKARGERLKEQEFYAWFDERAEKARQEFDLPGAALFVYKDGEVRHEGFYGEKRVGEKELPDRQTLYQIGSVTKSFTGTGICMLKDRGLLELDRPVRDYLPWLRFGDPYLTSHGTIRDLLCHRTGLERRDEIWLFQDYSRRQLIELLEELPVSAPLGSKWEYQNLCYVALGCVIQEITGRTWEKFTEEEILNPLGMDRTYFYIQDMREEPDRAFPYKRPEEGVLHGLAPEQHLSWKLENREKGIGVPHGPAGGLISCIADLEKWTALQLGFGEQILSPEMRREMQEPWMPMGGPLYLACPEQELHSYGLGWMMEWHRGVKLIHHGGNVPGYGALAAFAPELRLGIGVCMNLHDTTFGYGAVYEILDYYLRCERGYSREVPEGNWFSRELEWMRA